ncbi:nephronectin-like [Argopecten irradians]|uniref:nephronectin-like n=1 Tax=Argopecten irradians TaxID=31199 RepID=UPI00371BA635
MAAITALLVVAAIITRVSTAPTTTIGTSTTSDVSDPCASCHKYAECSNNVCTCRAGYVGNGFYCEINECTMGRCDANADCFKSVGSFRCVCRPGFQGNGFTCKPTVHPNTEPRIQRSSDTMRRDTSYRSINHELLPVMRPKPNPEPYYPTMSTSPSTWFSTGEPTSTTTNLIKTTGQQRTPPIP